MQAAGDKLTELALASIGVKPSEKTDTSRLPRSVALRIEAAKDLNAGEEGQGLPTVARIYKLRDYRSFMATPYPIFMSPEREKQALGEDLLEVRELILLPGKTTDLREKVPGEAMYLGVVAMFRNPSPQRWRFAFTTALVEGPGIVIGAHTCALTASTLAPVGMTLDESTLLSSARCK